MRRPFVVQAKQACADIEKHLQAGPVGEITEAFKAMNAALKPMSFEVRSTPDGSGGLVHTMVNLTDDDIAAKNGTRLNASEMEVFKKAVKAIGASSDGKLASEGRGIYPVTDSSD